MLPINGYSSSTSADLKKKKKKVIFHPSFHQQNEHCHRRLLSLVEVLRCYQTPLSLTAQGSINVWHPPRPVTQEKNPHTHSLLQPRSSCLYIHPSRSLTDTHTHTHTHQGYSKFLFVFIFFLSRAQIKEIIECLFLVQWPFLWKSSSSCEKQTNDSHRADTWSTGTKGSYFLWIGTVAFRFSDWLTFLDRKKISHSEGELLCCGNPPFRLSGRFLVNDHFRLYFMQLGENSNAPCEEETHKTAGRKCENVCENVKSDYGLVAKWLVRLISRGSVGFYWACAALQSLTAKSCVIEQVTFLTLGLH